MFAYVDGPFSYVEVLGFSFLFGMMCGFLYEFFRILRTARAPLFTSKRKVMNLFNFGIIFVEDIIYFVLITACAVVFVFVFNRGQVRLSMLPAIGLGFFVYLKTIGRFLKALHGAMLRIVYRLILWIYHYTLRYVFIFLIFIIKQTLGRVYLLLYKQLLNWLYAIQLKCGRRRLDKFLHNLEGDTLTLMDDHVSLG